MGGRLKDRRVLVVGASSGIGRATVLELAAKGAQVAAAARRLDRLEELASDPGGIVAVACDLTQENAVDACVEATLEALGGLDALVITSAILPLKNVADASAADWSQAFATNVSGISALLRAARPALSESRGRVVCVSSISTQDWPPRRGMGLYLTSKAALDKLLEVWQAENREIGFTRVSVGDTGSTEMAADWDARSGQKFVQEWIAQGYMYGRAMEPAAVARHLVELVAAEEAIPFTSLVPRFPESQ